MKKTCKKIVAMMIVMMMIVSNMTTLAHASQIINGNTWRGDEMTLQIAEGDEGYNYMIVGYKPSADVSQNFYYYETSNHALKKEVTKGGAVHLIPVVNTKENAGEWTPSGLYVFGESNYDVMYCCDAKIQFESGTYYKKINLEDSEYYTKEQGEKLRGILMNCYPYVTIEEMKDFLKTQGFEYAEQLDRSEIISAVQAAVWSVANAGNGDSFDYKATATTKWKLTWGGYMHEFSSEITNFADSTTKASQKVYNDIGTRINALRDFLLAFDPVEAPDNQIVINNVEIIDRVPSIAQDGTFTTTIKVALNNSGSGENDSIKLAVYVGDVLTKVENVVLGTDEYQFTVDAKVGQTIKAVVSGMQDLPRGVYFYIPKPADVDGDGIATSREVSQNLIAVSSGMTEVYAAAEVVVPNETELTVNKTWSDDDNRDGIRPESVTIRLMADGTEVAFAVLNAENNWKYTFKNIPVVNAEGALINYTVAEDAVPGYEAVVDQYSVTNVHQPELILIDVEKNWDDGDNRDGIRPESITINLLANGQIIDTKVVTEADEWAWTFENLYKYENGEEIIYTITEEAVEGYESIVDGFNVTNKYNPEQITVSGSKTWDDADNVDGLRPESITINLLANGQIIDTKVVTEADDWAWTFENLYKYENGEEIVYTITEEAVEGYQSTVDGFNVTNTHVPAQEDVEDPEVPLGPGEEVDDPEVPLGPGNVPETGDVAELSKWIATGMTSVAALAGFSVASCKAKKREED